MFRGGTSTGRDQEIQINKCFPDVPIFLEKPVATGDSYVQSVKEVFEVAEVLQKDHHPVVSVGSVASIHPLAKLTRPQILPAISSSC
jgi:hypothetical protein